MSTNQLIQTACEFYEKCLELYPEQHRREYGQLMVQLFRDRCRDVIAQGSLLSFGHFVAHMIIDVSISATKEHFIEINRLAAINRKALLVQFHAAELICGFFACMVSFNSFHFGMQIFWITTATATISGTIIASIIDRKLRQTI